MYKDKHSSLFNRERVTTHRAVNTKIGENTPLQMENIFQSLWNIFVRVCKIALDKLNPKLYLAEFNGIDICCLK